MRRPTNAWTRALDRVSRHAKEHNARRVNKTEWILTFFDKYPCTVYKEHTGISTSDVPAATIAAPRKTPTLASGGRCMTRPFDPRLTPFLPLVQGLASMLGSDCEVVLHDLSALPNSIVAIENGHVTGRAVGDVPSDLMLRTLRRVANGFATPRIYLSTTRGRTLRSLSVTLRDAQGQAFGLLGVNLDVSSLTHAQRALGALTTAPQEQETADTEEIFATDIREVVAGMISKALAEAATAPAQMTREDKMEVVKRLEERGTFLVKRAAEQVAEALDLSRFTVYSYLKEIRHQTAAGSPATLPDSGPGQ